MHRHILNDVPYSGKVWQGESLTSWLFSSIWQKKVWRINRSANRLSIVSTKLDGFSLANHGRFAKFTKLSPCQTFPLYGSWDESYKLWLFNGCHFDSWDYGDVLYGTSGGITIQEVIETFSSKRCPTLIGKPKIFIIQACRGRRYNQAVQSTERNNYECDQVLNILDYLVAYSTIHGNVSLRNKNTGSILFLHYNIFGLRVHNWYKKTLWSDKNIQIVLVIGNVQ